MKQIQAKHLFFMAYVLLGTGSLVMILGLLELALEGKKFSWVGMGSIWMGVIALVVAKKKQMNLKGFQMTKRPERIANPTVEENGGHSLPFRLP